MVRRSGADYLAFTGFYYWIDTEVRAYTLAMDYDEVKAESVDRPQETAEPVQMRSATIPAAAGEGYLQQRAALSPRQPLIDPETGKQVGTYLDYDGVIKVFDQGGQIVWIDEQPLQHSIGPTDIIFGLKSIIAAAGVAVKGLAMEATNRAKQGGKKTIEERIPEPVWAQLRAASK
jgi:hypothetical protein